MEPSPILAGPNITLLRWSEPNDLDDAWTAFDDDAAWPRESMLPGHTRPTTRDQFQAYIRAKFTLPLAVYTVRTRTNEFVGFTGIHTAAADQVELGATIYVPGFWGGREIQEGRRLILDWAFDSQDTRLVFWIAFDDNARSVRSLLALGAREVARKGPGLRKFVLDAEDWPPIRARLLAIAAGTHPSPHQARAPRM